MPKEKKETTTKARSKVLVSQKIIVSFLVVSSLAVLLGIGGSIVQMIASPRLMIQKDPGGGGGGYVPPTSCGDATCNGNENCSTCPADCGDCGDSSLALWIPLDSNTDDDSIYHNPVYCPFQSCPTSTNGPRPGQGAYNFDGTDDYLIISDADILDVDTVTLAAWVRPDRSGQRYARILSKEYGTTAPYAIYTLFLNSANQMEFYLGVNNNRERVISDTVIPINQWTHVVATYDGVEMRIHLNGQLTDSALASSPGPIQDNDRVVTVSNSQFYSPRFFSGDLSDLRIYNRPLSLVEIQTLYGEEPICTDNDEDGYNISGDNCGPSDCNDDNPDINPGAIEICDNGIDDNCNDVVDENCDPQLICDNDEDNYDALPENSENECNGNDCNDNNPTIHPGALDVCGDTIDQDCSGQAAACQACTIGNAIGLAGCNCDGANYYTGYCCEDGWQSTSCSGEPSGSTCSEGAISSECSCGGDDYQTGYCCNDVWNPTSCNQSWNLLYLKDYEDGQILDEYSNAPWGLATGYQIENGVLRGNMVDDLNNEKRSQRIILNLATMGLRQDEGAEFYLKSDVRFDPSNVWCCVSLTDSQGNNACYNPSTICPNGIDGAKFGYAFGQNGVAWVPSSNPGTPNDNDSWQWTDNDSSGGTGYAPYFGSDFLATNFDGQWHEWVWYFKHNTNSDGIWNWDGVFEWYSDGQLVYSNTETPYTVETSPGGFNRIDKPMTYFGGSGRLANDWWYWIDNIEIWGPDSALNP
ncbi:hypothetical protein KKB10_05400 [Patescibacteria group bacterium]|nr:hypothetical protein [Patescibacteria group bacterium]